MSSKTRMSSAGSSARRLIGWAVRLLLTAPFLLSNSAAALERGEFGWRLSEARGTRPLLVIWVRRPDDTPASELQRR